MNTRDQATLVVDDDEATLKLVTTNLEMRGLRTVTASNGREALRMFNAHDVDLVILDLDIPAPNGFDVCTRIRAESDVPILILSALADVDSRTLALECGADQYITKPFGIPELIEQVDVLQSRHSSPQPLERHIFESGSLILDLAERTATRDGQIARLTTTEFRIIRLLIQHEGDMVNGGTIVRRVWGPSSSNRIENLRSHIRRLRVKIEIDAEDPAHLIGQRALGYGFFA